MENPVPSCASSTSSNRYKAPQSNRAGSPAIRRNSKERNMMRRQTDEVVILSGSRKRFS